MAQAYLFEATGIEGTSAGLVAALRRAAREPDANDRAELSAGRDGVPRVKVSFLDSTETRLFKTTEHVQFACRR